MDADRVVNPARREFTLAEAREWGLTRRALRGGGYRRVAQGVYREAGVPETPEMILRSLHRSLPGDAVFSGLTAAWLHGLSAKPCEPAEVTVPEPTWLRPKARLAVVRTRLQPEDLTILRGLTATAALRTLTDVGRRCPLVDAVVLLDEALHRGLVTKSLLERHVITHAGRKGIARLRRAVSLVEPATESPMESRLRLVLVLGGLPPPAVQVPIHMDGEFIARPDLLYPEQRLALEYDGEGHRNQLAQDNRRQNRLVQAGYRILRFTAGDVMRHSEAVVAQVRAQLAA